MVLLLTPVGEVLLVREKLNETYLWIVRPDRTLCQELFAVRKALRKVPIVKVSQRLYCLLLDLRNYLLGR